MANLPISSLPIAISLDGSESVPIVQGGTTKRATIDQITSDAGLNLVRSDGGVSALGNIAFFTNTTSTRIGASPIFHPGNPGTAALYTAMAYPGVGTGNTLSNMMQLSLGTPIQADHQIGSNIYRAQQGLVATLDIPAGDTATIGNAIAGYANSNSVATSQLGTPPAPAGIFGQGSLSVDGANAFGGNSVAQNFFGPDIIGHDANFISGHEFDCNLFRYGGPTGRDPVIAGDNAYGAFISGGGNVIGPVGSALGINQLNFTANAKWNHGVRTLPAAAVSAFTAGPAATGVSTRSQYISAQGVDGGGITRSALFYADSGGNAVLSPFVGTTGIIFLEDGNGTPLLSTSGAFGGGKVRIAAFTAAGVVTNDVTTGQLNSVTTLPSGLTIPSPTVTGPITITLGSDATGDVYYRNSGGLLTRLGIGSSGNVLTVAAGLPSWVTPAAAAITVGTTTVSGGTTTRVLFDNAGVLGEYSITGSGNVAMSASPTFTGTVSSAAISNSGNIASSTFDNVIITTPASTATLTLGSAKTVTISNTLTFTGTDGSSVAFGAGGTVLYSSAAAGGDLTGTYPNPTLAAIITAGGPTGSAAVAPIITYDAKGRLTAVSSATITPAVGSITGLGTGVGAWLATPSSANLATAITDETGSGALVFGTSPTIATPVINGLPTGTGVATANTASTLVARDGSGNFSAGTITAALSGNATTATSATSATTATTATNATNTAITDDTTTNTSMNLTWVTSNTGNLPQKTTSTKLTFNPSTGALSSTSFTGAGTGLTGTAASLTAGSVTTNANLTGDVTSVGNATTLTNAPVIAKVLTGYTSGAGTVSAADSILSAFQKINGNDALKLPLTGGTLTGALLFSTDNTIDIGASGATRPRAGYYGTSISSPLLIGGSAASSTLTLESTSGAGTTDAILLKTGSQVDRMQIATGGQVNIGPNVAATANFTINRNIVSPSSSGASNIIFQANGADGAITNSTMDGYGTGAFNIWTFRAARGIGSAFTASQSGDNFGLIGFVGATAANTFATTGGAAGGAFVAGNATENWSATNQGSQLKFFVTQNTTAAISLAMVLQNSTGLSVGVGAADPGAGGITSLGRIVDAGYGYFTPVTAGTVTLSNTVSHNIIDPAGTLAALTINMPPTPIDGQVVDIRISQVITALTVSGNGNSVKGNPTTAAVGSSFSGIYKISNTTWYF